MTTRTATRTGPAVYLGTHTPGSPQWHALRAGGIGASEIAAVLGLSPWESAFSLWQRKAGRIGPAPETDEMTWGKYLEEPIAHRFADTHPELRVTRTGTWASREHPWQLCNPDRLAGRIPIECKFAPYGDGFGPSGSGEFPVYYRCQLQQQCAVLGAPYGWLVALVGASYREYLVDADPLDAGVLTARGGAFWSSLPSQDDPTGTPPLIDGSDHTYQALRELHPNVEDRAVQIPESLRNRVRDTAFEADEAATAKQKARSDLLDVMGQARRAKFGEQLVATRVAYANGTVQLRLAKEPKTTGTTITENV